MAQMTMYVSFVLVKQNCDGYFLYYNSFCKQH